MINTIRRAAVRAGKAACAMPATVHQQRTYVGAGRPNFNYEETVDYTEMQELDGHCREMKMEIPPPWTTLLESDTGESALLYAPLFYEPDDADALLQEIQSYVRCRN